MTRTDRSPQTPDALARIAIARAALAGAAAACLLAAAAMVPALVHAKAAQAQSTQATQTPPSTLGSAARPVHQRKRPSPTHAAAIPDPPVPSPAPVTPPAPPPPSWPAFDKPAEAAVVWDSHGLTIDAANASLQQILKDFSAATGAKVEGLSGDQRVFGAFGPGQARDVLSQLLQGSGYNVLMIGDQGHGAPRQILLTVRQAGPAQPAARNNGSSNDEDDADDQPPAAPEPLSNRPGFPPGAPPRSPQQIMQEMQQRQQQQQQQNPPAPPN